MFNKQMKPIPQTKKPLPNKADRALRQQFIKAGNIQPVRFNKFYEKTNGR